MAKGQLFFLFGGPASGQSTQGMLLAEYLGYQNVALIGASEVVRLGVCAGAVSGYSLKDLEVGKPFDERGCAQLVLLAISSVPSDKHIVVEGFPRTEFQAVSALEQARKLDRLSYFIQLDIHEEVSFRRVLGLVGGTNVRLIKEKKEFSAKFGQRLVGMTGVARTVRRSRGWHFAVDGSVPPGDVQKRIRAIVAV